MLVNTDVRDNSMIRNIYPAGGANETQKQQDGGRLKNMKIVELCKEGSCCPVVKVTDSQVEIGEKDNTCVLTITQWEILKEKILSQEL